MSVNDSYFDSRNERGSTRIACTIWLGPNIGRVVTDDTGDTVIRKMIEDMQVVNKKVTKLEGGSVTIDGIFTPAFVDAFV